MTDTLELKLEVSRTKSRSTKLMSKVVEELNKSYDYSAEEEKKIADLYCRTLSVITKSFKRDDLSQYKKLRLNLVFELDDYIVEDMGELLIDLLSDEDLNTLPDIINDSSQKVEAGSSVFELMVEFPVSSTEEDTTRP